MLNDEDMSDFTYECLEVAEEEVRENFDGISYAEEGMHMNMVFF